MRDENNPPAPLLYQVVRHRESSAPVVDSHQVAQAPPGIGIDVTVQQHHRYPSALELLQNAFVYFVPACNVLKRREEDPRYILGDVVAAEL